MRSIFISCIWLLSCLVANAQDWERVKADNSFIWGEGWGTSVEEADRQALSSLASKVAVAVVSDFRQVEEQVTSSRGDEHFLMQSNRSSAFSSVTMSDTRRIVLRGGRRSHVGRWIRRDELDAIFADRKSRILEYEECALNAEAAGRVDDALRYHYWAYVLLRFILDVSPVRTDLPGNGPRSPRGLYTIESGVCLLRRLADGRGPSRYDERIEPEAHTQVLHNFLHKMTEGCVRIREVSGINE